MILPEMTGEKRELSQQDVDLTTETLFFFQEEWRVIQQRCVSCGVIWGNIYRILEDGLPAFPYTNPLNHWILGFFPSKTWG